LFRAFVDLLHADADAEEGPLGFDRLERDLVEPRRPQRLHAPAEVAHPGKDDPRRVAHQTGIGRQPGVGPHVLERLLGRAQVADAVVEHCDEGHDEDPHWRIRTLWPMGTLWPNMGAPVTAPPWSTG